MPAERSKATAKRSNGAHATQLVWAVDPPASAEAPTNCNVSFAANITCTTFEITSSSSPSSTLSDDLPPLVDAPATTTTEFQIFNPYDENSGLTTTGSKRIPHSKKKPDNHIPRPPNAFILFRSSFIKSQHVSAEVETNHSTLSKIIGMTWQNLPEEQRQAWHAKARLALAEHRKKFPKYTFRPTQNKIRTKVPGTGGGGTGQDTAKRKVREVEPKDLKRCAKIAELLVEGKKGAELDVAIQEFDRHHVPEIVTRFEAPITARAFRRSSSAPIPDTENSKKSQTFLTKSPVLRAKDGKRKLPRATSIQPTRCSTPDQDDGRFDELISATMKQEPSMDFSAFSFANMNQQPAPAFQCDPLSPISPAQSPAFLQIGDTCSAPAPLSIPNLPSFLMDDWSLSSSPISPFSQCDTFASPSPVMGAFDPFDNGTFEALDLNQSTHKHYPIAADTLDLSGLSLPPNYDSPAGVGINMSDLDMNGLVNGFEGTDYLDLLTQPSCAQQQYQQSPFYHVEPHFEYLQHQQDLDLTSLMTANIAAPSDFML